MTTLRINSGDVQLLEDKIIIDDKSSRQSAKQFKFFPIVFLLFAIFTFNKAINAPNDKIAISFIVGGVGFVLFFIMIKGFDFNKINDKEIRLSDIESVKINSQLWNRYIVIQLKNSKRRRIYNFKKEDEIALEKYFKDKNIIVKL